MFYFYCGIAVGWGGFVLRVFDFFWVSDFVKLDFFDGNGRDVRE